MIKKTIMMIFLLFFAFTLYAQNEESENDDSETPAEEEAS